VYNSTHKTKQMKKRVKINQYFKEKKASNCYDILDRYSHKTLYQNLRNKKANEILKQLNK